MVATVEVQTDKLKALGTSPSGPIYQHWLSIMARIDAAAKQNLSNSMVHVRTGNLRSSQSPPIILVEGGKIRGISQNTATYARFIHDGTKPHQILPKNGQFLTGWVYDGGPVFTRSVNHPGTQPHPFLRQAMETVIATTR